MNPKPQSSSPGFFRRYRVIGTVALILLAGSYEVFRIVTDTAAPKKRVLETIAVKIIPPPPPPPPPPAPPPPPKMVEQQKIEPPAEKPDDAPKTAPQSQAADLGASQGPCTANCVATSGNDPTYKPQIGDSRPSGNGFRRYAVMMQDQIGKRLHQDDKLDVSRFRVTIKIWLSEAGRVEKVELSRKTGDGQMDQRIEQAIASMPAMPEAPPKEMPQPIVVRIGATPGFG